MKNFVHYFTPGHELFTKTVRWSLLLGVVLGIIVGVDLLLHRL